MTVTIGRRELLAALGGVAAAWPPFVCAQPENKLWRIGFLSPRAPSQINLIDAFRQGMRDLGYVEGRTFLIEARYADGQYDRLPTLARELLELGADIILAVGSPAIRAAQLATKTVPIVMAGSGDPVANGLVVSLARPGGNTTGSSLISPTSARSTSNS
jgi:putative tryptophan/tyrosine transport system substrate-binding protein